ncbi:AGC/AGC-Unique protein kinase [Coprinopsis cinerea okayama7|uniref:AGC/AGC-Unique protein kinase n=1 Tax=Coprinopsis cinerea (strain Okayama-7 / 130 / ATCC MYA-4618 / FGSC 9003) TaxID=240176 RepID=A8N0Q1_COPC7|nr:AGC/AGC-Unique protein kinase [Coprinopsis cinerea okayama7\|eukprot:XP_001828383.2 AGC/AGC-Unique protein kinase [Coprinopsis cinerea okayama7\
MQTLIIEGDEPAFGQCTDTSTGTVLRDLSLSPRPSVVDGLGEVSTNSTTPPRLDVEWPNSPPLAVALRFSGIFDDADVAEIEGDLTRQTHQSRSPTFDMTYDIHSFPNIKDINLEMGNDSDISEVVVMSQKQLPTALSTIPEANEPSPVLAYTTSLSDFDIISSYNAPDSDTRVMICQRKRNGNLYKIRSRRIYDHFPWMEQDILETLRDMGAPFLPYLKSVFREENQVHLVLDYWPSASLRELLAKYGTLGSQRVLFYASELLTGIANLHGVGIMHRNLNPDDIILDKRGHIVITNFEFANTIPPSGVNANSFNSDLVLSIPRFHGYQAPEMVLGWAHDISVDCWGFGMLLYFMYFGKHPFQEDRNPVDHRVLRARIIQGSLSPESLRLIHPHTRDIILKCVERNPRIRLNVDGIKNHEYFNNVPWGKVADKLVEVPPLPGFFNDNGSSGELLRRSHSSGLRHTLYQEGAEPVVATPEQPRPALLSPIPSHRPSHPLPLSPSPSAVTFASRPMSPSVLTEMSEPLEGNLSIQSPKPRTFRPFLDPQASAQSAKGGQVDSGMEIWDLLDREEQGSIASSNLGRSHVLGFLRPRKLRKNNSSTSLFRPFVLNLSTSSLTRGLKKKKSRSSTRLGESSATVHDPQQRNQDVELPAGIEHIGSGIGFHRNTLSSDSGHSRSSASSNLPRFCRGGVKLGHRFSFSALRPSGARKIFGRNTRSRSLSSTMATNSGDASALGGLRLAHNGNSPAYVHGHTGALPGSHTSPRTPHEVQASTPILQMNPMSPSGSSSTSASASSSPRTEDGPLTPTTVACDEECQARVSSKAVMDFDEVNKERGRNDLTLRLVPSSRGLQLSV